MCVGFDDWDTELLDQPAPPDVAAGGRDNRVLFVESLGLRRPQLGSGRDLRRIAPAAAPRPARGRGAATACTCSRRSCFRCTRNALVRRAQRAGCCARRSAGRRGGSGCSARSCGATCRRPRCCSTRSSPTLVVYHCVDDIAAQEGIDAASFRAAEERFARRADLVHRERAGARRAHARRSPTTCSYAPNVADTELLRRPRSSPGPVDPALAALPEPRIVFVGRDRREQARLRAARRARRARAGLDRSRSSARSGWATRTPTSPRSRREPNVHLLGPRAHAELPAVLRGADVGLIPYAVSELTASIFPMKVYEYLAAGLPVVATRLPALEGVDDVALVDGADEAVAAIEPRAGARTRPSAVAPAAPPCAATRGRPGSPRSARRPEPPMTATCSSPRSRPTSGSGTGPADLRRRRGARPAPARSTSPTSCSARTSRRPSTAP